jgi:hypothetical protein
VTAAVGALLLAGASTLGDFIWARWIPEHRPVYGLAHGTLLFLVLGAWLGAVSGRPLAGTAGGAAIGFGAAATFYALAPWLGAVAMFAAWFLLWIAVAALAARLGAAPQRPGETALRGLAAALGSGLGFWAISGIWISPGPGGPDYLWHLVAWSVAFLPGFLALHLGGTRGAGVE